MELEATFYLKKSDMPDEQITGSFDDSTVNVCDGSGRICITFEDFDAIAAEVAKYRKALEVVKS